MIPLPQTVQASTPWNKGKLIGQDRKSVVQGKSVDLGGRRIIKKKKIKKKGGMKDESH